MLYYKYKEMKMEYLISFFGIQYIDTRLNSFPEAIIQEYLEKFKLKHPNQTKFICVINQNLPEFNQEAFPDVEFYRHRAVQRNILWLGIDKLPSPVNL